MVVCEHSPPTNVPRFESWTRASLLLVLILALRVFPLNNPVFFPPQKLTFLISKF